MGQVPTAHASTEWCEAKHHKHIPFACTDATCAQAGLTAHRHCQTQSPGSVAQVTHGGVPFVMEVRPWPKVRSAQLKRWLWEARPEAATDDATEEANPSKPELLADPLTAPPVCA